ncbi:MAG: serine hydrolase domain-containing protein [Lysobacter sp.]
MSAERGDAMSDGGWRRWLAGVVALACAMPAGRAAERVDGASVLPAQIEQALKEERLAGAVWATVDSDGAIRTGAAGLSNVTTGEAMTPDSKVHVGSIAKSLVATGVLQLVSAGRVDLDAPLSRYLPALHLPNRWQATHPVRVRHLLDHSAGLDDMRLWQMFSTRPTPDTPLLEAFNRDPSVLAIRSRPGSRFSYSNMSYTLAAMVIEAVTRERYEAWLDHELLRPLGMRDSTFRFTTQLGPASDPRLAWGHLDIISPASALPSYLRPAGQFTTTAHDLALFAKFLMGDGRVNGRMIVQPELLRTMARASTTDAARAGLQAGYALGLGRRDRHGVVGLCHGGDVVGFHAMLCLFPSVFPSVFPSGHATQAGKAFVIVENTDGDGMNTGRFDALLVKALAIPPPPAAPPAPAPRDVADWQGRYVPAPNRLASFRYVDFLFDSPRLGWDGKVLRLSPVQGPARTLTPAGGMRFTANDRSTASHVLLKGEGGQRLLSDGQRTYRRVHAAPYWTLVASLALGLLGLLWFALAVPARALMRREPILVPGVAAVLLLLLPVPLFLLQSYMQLGDHTVASTSLYAVTAALPWLMLWQAWRSARRDEGLAHGRVNLVAALLVLQWCAVLASWGMLPFALWR